MGALLLGIDVGTTFCKAVVLDGGGRVVAQQREPTPWIAVPTGAEVEPEALAGDARLAERAMRDNVIQTERLRAGLPRHRDLIRKVVEHGLQPV